MLRLDWREFDEVVKSPVLRTDLASDGVTVIVVANPPSALEYRHLTQATQALTSLVVLNSDEEPPDALMQAVDVVAAGAVLEAIVERATARPIATVSLAMLLRGSERRSVDEGLAAESAVYSTLQSGPEFEHWRTTRSQSILHPSDRPAVITERLGDTIVITLDRPEVHNAFNTRMRDDLCEALVLAAVDTGAKVRLVGTGDSFCSGGDLTEFGTFPDPATAHLTRLARSAGRILDEISGRVTVELHGACMGSGIELAAFCGRVLARRDTVIGLPEIDLGLIPGAGGTVSVPRRIGRHRTAWLALSGKRIDAETAMEWGLVDQIVES